MEAGSVICGYGGKDQFVEEAPRPGCDKAVSFGLDTITSLVAFYNHLRPLQSIMLEKGVSKLHCHSVSRYGPENMGVRVSIDPASRIVRGHYTDSSFLQIKLTRASSPCVPGIDSFDGTRCQRVCLFQRLLVTGFESSMEVRNEIRPTQHNHIMLCWNLCHCLTIMKRMKHS
jgi:hypothetical protein